MKSIKKYFNKNKYIIIAFLTAFIPRIVCTFFMNPMKVLMDEMCTLNGAAKFAGLNWNNVVERGSYYGFGFYGLFSFVFKITSNPYVIYHIILLILAGVQSLVAPISFHLLTKIFKIVDYKWCMLISTTCSYMVVTRATSFVNEHPLILITWLIVWLILLLCDEYITKRKKTLYTFLLVLLLFYAQLLHTRSITFLIALLTLIIIYGIVYHKILVSLSVLGGSLLILFPLGQYLIHNYQNSIWSNGENVINATINVSLPVSILEGNNIRAIINIALGEINTIGVYTGGISYLAIVVCICVIAQCIKEKNVVITENVKMFAIIIFCGTCIAVSIAGIMFSWNTGVEYGITKHITYDYYSYKAYTYLRYFGPYLGPLLMVMFLYMKQKQKVNLMMLATVVIIVPIQIYWLEYIIPYIHKNSTTNSAFMLFAMWKEEKALGSYIYDIGIMAMLVLFFVYGRLQAHKREILSVILIFTLLTAQYFYGVYAQDRVWAKGNMEQADAGYELIKKLEEQIELPREIYVWDNLSTSHHKSYFMYQFLLNRYTIIPWEEKMEIAEGIVFENTGKEKYIDALQQQGFEYVKVDENEFIFVKGRSLIEKFQSAGVNFNL